MLAQTWRVPVGFQLVWRQWEDEVVLFNPQSGDTHLLDLVAWEGLSCLQKEAMDCSQLAINMAQRLEIPRDDQLHRYVAQLLEEFERLGLVEVIRS